jgi:hypothetical protein
MLNSLHDSGINLDVGAGADWIRHEISEEIDDENKENKPQFDNIEIPSSSFNIL